jgi:transcriptional regulator with XRE-family HTH domain
LQWADIISEHRRQMGLTQAEFGELFNRDPNTVSRWERGDLRPNAEVQSKLRDMMLDYDPVLANMVAVERCPLRLRYSAYSEPWMTIGCTRSYSALYGLEPKALRHFDMREIFEPETVEMINRIADHPAVKSRKAVCIEATVPHRGEGSMRKWGQSFIGRFWRWDIQFHPTFEPTTLSIMTLDDLKS